MAQPYAFQLSSDLLSHFLETYLENIKNLKCPFFLWTKNTAGSVESNIPDLFSHRRWCREMLHKAALSPWIRIWRCFSQWDGLEENGGTCLRNPCEIHLQTSGPGSL